MNSLSPQINNQDKTNIENSNQPNIYNHAKINANPVIGTPDYSPKNPAPNQNVQVTSNISDADGIKNATLFWQFGTLPTVYNTSMTPSQVADFSYVTASGSNPWNTTGYINSSGMVDTGPTTHFFGEYVFEPTAGTIYSGFSMTVARNNTPANNNVLVYWSLFGKNISSGEWNLYDYYSGKTNLSTTGTTGNVPITTDNISTAYKVFVVVYDGNTAQLNVPRSNSIYAYFSEFSGTISPPGNITQVSYYITTFNNLDNVSTSSTYNYLADNIPTIVLTGSTSRISAKHTYFFNVTVTDLDGISDINNNSVIGFLYTSDPNIYSQVSLQYDRNTSLDTVVFNTTINTAFLSGLKGFLHLYVNASDLIGQQGKSNILDIPIDADGPSLVSFSLNATYKDFETNTYWVFNTSEIPRLTVTLQDNFGVKDATLFYRENNGPFTSILMNNITLNEITNTNVDFNATLPASSVTKTIEFYIVSHDFGDTQNTTSLMKFYFDNDAPVLVQKLIFPPSTMNITQPLLLFNVSDLVGQVTPITIYYSYDNQESWSTTTSSTINYNSATTYRNSTTYTYAYLPYQIPDNEISNISKRIIFPYTVDQAILTLGVTHTQGAYLRIWLSNDLGKKGLVFDRITGDLTNAVYSIDLLKLGFETQDFRNSTFYLIIQDDSAVYYGQIDQFSIRLRDYNIPLGYQYLVSNMPATGNDTNVFYFFNLKDKYNHEFNSSIFSFYSDGSIPLVTVNSPLESNTSLNMAGASKIIIDFNVTDNGGLFLVELYYKINNQTTFDDWQIVEMHLNTTNGNYYFEVPLSNASGTLYFKLRAYDNVGFSNTTDEYMIPFINANIPQTTQQTSQTTTQTTQNNEPDLLVPLVGGLAVIGIAGAGIVLYPKLKKGGKLTQVREKISSKRPKGEK
jgi:hypothetical protein